MLGEEKPGFAPTKLGCISNDLTVAYLNIEDGLEVHEKVFTLGGFFWLKKTTVWVQTHSPLAQKKCAG